MPHLTLYLQLVTKTLVLTPPARPRLASTCLEQDKTHGGPGTNLAGGTSILAFGDIKAGRLQESRGNRLKK